MRWLCRIGVAASICGKYLRQVFAASICAKYLRQVFAASMFAKYLRTHPIYFLRPCDTDQVAVAGAEISTRVTWRPRG